MEGGYQTMSKQIDERVVSMQFDNKQFEKNVSNTMSTLDKLKHSLRLDGASKGFDSINDAAKKVNLSPLGKAVEEVRVKFSALEVMGITALANITNSAINAGKRIASALTIQPITTGLQEYETQINAVQTIMANVKSKGYTIDDVNASLSELNEYADQTIYNFTEMTRNIGTFTAAGVDLKAATNNIKGLANAAAMAGANSQQASTAMYQMSQAMSSGTVKLQDWLSLENNSMAGVAMQEALKETARVHGIAIDDMIEHYGSFRYTLQEGWLTAELFSETLDKFTMTTEGLTDAEIEANRERWRSIGYTEEQIDKIFELGETATNAATKVKTFSQMWDVLKETAQSGWSKTWQLIFGDFEEAKSLFTPLTNFLTDIINGMSDARNSLLEGALGSPLGQLADKITNVTGSIQNAVETVQDYSKIVEQIMSGDLGVGQERIQKLTDAGYDWAHAQNLVNEALSDSTRHATNYTEAQAELNEVQSVNLDQLTEMSEEQLKTLGYTEEQIEAIQILSKHAKEAGVPLSEFVKDLDQVSGRTLLIESFKNVGQSLVKVFTAMRDAWVEIFPPMTSMQLYDIIASINEFSQKLAMGDETADKLRRTLKGVFALLDIITTITGGALKTAIKIVGKLLSEADLDILSITANVGDAIVNFRDWVDKVLDLGAAFETIAPYLKNAVNGVRDWINGLKEADNVPKYIIDGLKNGLKNGIDGVVTIVKELGRKIIDTIKDVLGIHSPSKEFFDIGMYTMQGFVEGLRNGAQAIWDAIKLIGEKCIEIIKNLDIGQVFAVAIGIGGIALVKELNHILDIFAKPLESLSAMLRDLGGMFESIGGYFNAKKLDMKSKALLNMAIAIGILVASVVVLTQVPQDKLWSAVGALGALSGILVGLAFAAKLMSKIGGFGKQTVGVLAVSAALLIVAHAMSELTTIDMVKAPDAMKLILKLLLSMSAILLVIGKLVDPKAMASIDKVGTMLTKMAVAVGLMVLVVREASKLTYAEVEKGIKVVGAIELLFAVVIAVSKLAGEHASKAGSMLLKMSVAMGIMIGVVKEASRLTYAEVDKGIKVVGAVELLFLAVIAVSKLVGQHASKAGSMMLKMSVAIGLMTGAVKEASRLSYAEVEKGIKVIGSIELLFAAVIAVSKLAGQHSSKAGSMLLKMSGAILVLTGAIFLLSKMDDDGVDRAVGVIAILETLFAGLIVVSRIAGDSKSTILTITTSILLLIVAVAALSLLDPKGLTAGVTALSMLMGTFAMLIKSTQSLGSLKNSVGPLLLLVGVVAILAVIVREISKLNPESAVGSAVALSTLLLSLSASLKILSGIVYISNDTIKNMYILSGVIGILAVILGVMSGLNVEASIPTAVALGVLLNAMAAAMVILDHVQYVSGSAMASLAVMGLVVGELAVILGLMSEFNVQPSLETATALSVLLLAMSGALVILSGVGAVAGAAIAGVGALAVLIGGIGALLVAIGAIVYAVPELETFVDIAIPILEKIGWALGSFFGNILGGFASGALSFIPDLGTYLSDFMKNAQPFIEDAKSISDESMVGVTNLVKMILLLTAADLLNSATSWLTGGSSMTDFAQQLAPFGTAMVNFSNIVDGKINGTAVEAAANAGAMLAEMANTIPKTGGLFQFFGGEHDMLTFSSQIKLFGNAIVGFSETVKGKIDGKDIEVAANAGSMLAEMANTIPKTGGLFQFFGGEHDMLTFSSQIKLFGNAIVGFSETVKGKIDGKDIEVAANAGSMLAEMAKTIPNTGGLFQFFSGEHDISTFSDQIVEFGAAIAEFSDTVADGIDENAVVAAATAGSMLAEMANTIPNSGGLFQFFSGEHDMEDFGEQLVDFGDAMYDFADSVDGINPDTTVAAAEAAKTIAGIANSLPDEIDFSVFGDEANLGSVAKAIKSFSDNSNGIQPYIVDNGVNAGKKVIELAKSIPGEGGIKGIFSGDKSSIDTFGAQLVSFGSSIKSFSSEVSGIDGTYISTAVTVGQQMIELAKQIPNDGGLKGFLAGDTDMTAFGKQLVSFGTAIKKFANAVSGIDSGSVSSATSSAEDIIEMTKRIPTSGGGIGTLASGSMSSFGEELVTLGESIKTFVETAGGVDVGTIERVIEQFETAMGDLKVVSETTLEEIKMIFENMKNTTESSFRKLETAFTNAANDITFTMNTMSNDMKSTFTEMEHTTNLSFSGLVNVVENANGEMSQGMRNMSKDIDKALRSMNKTSLAAFEALNYTIRESGTMIALTMDNALLTALNTIDRRKETFYDAGVTLMKRFINGINTAIHTISKVTEKIAAEALSGVNNYVLYDKFYNAGKYLVQGFANGITDNTYIAKAKAKAMAEAAARAAEEALDIHSPSRVFYEIGDFAGQGFVNAFVDNYANAYGAGSSIAESATKGLTNAISSISDIAMDSIDAEPTIRPVLDLSDIKSGAKQINTMFSRSQALAIDASQNKRHDEIQNGEAATSSGGNTYQFTQNNYSPKALSRVEIYRQTKNQFSAMERMVES